MCQEKRTIDGQPMDFKVSSPTARSRKRAAKAKRRGRNSRAGRAGRQHSAEAVRGGQLVARFIDDKGIVAVEDVAKWFGMSKGQLAATVGMRPDTFRRVKRVTAPKTQSRVKEMLEVIGRIADWAGGKDQAMAWYRAEPIPAFGGRTAESLVKDGMAA